MLQPTVMLEPFVIALTISQTAVPTPAAEVVVPCYEQGYGIAVLVLAGAAAPIVSGATKVGAKLAKGKALKSSWQGLIAGYLLQAVAAAVLVWLISTASTPCNPFVAFGIGLATPVILDTVGSFTTTSGHLA